MRLDNTSCLSFALPVVGGMAQCRTLLAGIDGGCGLPGLSQATPADLTAVGMDLQAQGVGPLNGALCELQELAASNGSPGCANEQAAGWCYVHGSCAQGGSAACSQIICTTGAFGSEHVSYAEGAWLACP